MDITTNERALAPGVQQGEKSGIVAVSALKLDFS